jgi:DNA-binding transcriptional LysR family regulator
MDLIGSLRVFARIAELGSFSAVARELRESHSAVTRQIGNLEAHLGARLFQRTTRGLTLTEDGRELLGVARQMLELAESMENGLGRQRESPQGRVRLGVLLAGEYLVRRIPKLFERYPGLSLELVMRDHPPDLIEEGLDLAVQRGPIANASLVARTYRVPRFVAVAAPSYLERRGEPQTPADLEHHDCILHSEFDGAGWQFAGPDGPYRISVPSRLMTNNSAAVHLAALDGQGIAMLLDFTVFDDIRSGRLRRLLAGHEAPGEPAYIVYPSRRHLAPRTRAVIDFLVEQAKELEDQIERSSQNSGRR